MTQRRARVTRHRRIARDHYLLALDCPPIARAAQPGQFVHVRCPADGAYAPLLRRPFSLYDLDRATGAVSFIYKVVGLGTETLRTVPIGAHLDVLGPLGTTFTAPGDLRHAILIGGGVGIPPLYFWAKELVKGRGSSVTVEAFLGARTAAWVICTKAFRRLGVPVRVATDDGTAGFHGRVVDLVQRCFSTTLHPPPFTSLYVCGPTPMMAAAAALARRWNIPAQASLEERMGCAMGVCMGCIVEIKGPHATAHKRFQRVCTEGPVFPAEAVVWRGY